jgi:hypothetical protein
VLKKKPRGEVEIGAAIQDEIGADNQASPFERSGR